MSASEAAQRKDHFEPALPQDSMPRWSDLLKAELTLEICRLIRKRNLTQAEAGKILGIKQPHVPVTDAQPPVLSRSNV